MNRLLAALGGIVVCASLAGAQRPHLIRGRVTTDSGVAIPAADIIVTIAPSAETVSGKSDSSGAYRISIEHPTGEYLLYIGALGRKPFRQRVTIAAKDSVAVVDAKLAAAVTTVAAVQVQARKARPQRSLNNEGFPGYDANDRTVDGAVNALPPDLQKNLEAMASFIPGLAIGPTGGVSAFGLGADANSTTLNGLAFGGSDLPRDAQTGVRFKTSVWDPTVGGFSGVQTATTIGSGGNVATRRGHITLDAPSLQFSDAVASRLGQKYTNLSLDEGGVGPYRLDKLYYNFGIHFARQTASVASLTDLDPDALARAGVASDSAARLLQVLSGLHVPVSQSGIPRDRTTTTVSFLERVDRAPKPTPPGAAPAPILATTFIGKYSQSEASSLSPTLAPATSGKNTNGLFGVQGLYSRFFGKDGDYVSETTSGLSLSTTHGTPYLELPGGTVLITSADGIGPLGFGGNSALANDSRTWTWETINQTNFLARNKASLPMKIYLQSRFDGYSQSLAANRLGRFSFASLNDVALNQPTSFSRTLNAPDRSGGEWIGAAAVGGSWTNGGLALTGGGRIDANAFTAAPRYNADLDRTFGARTDHAPNTVGLSPRFGFTWNYRQPKPNAGLAGGPSIMVNPAAIAIRGPQVIRGGFGKFRSVPQPTLLADATSSTGLPGGMQQLLCIGSAAPIPAWSSYSADPSTIPSSCVGGAPTFADTARSVTLFDRNFAPPESWRANLGWTAAQFFGTYLSADVTYSYNMHQAGTVDLNFAGTPRFSLPGESNRPVFVNPASIVTTTGTVSPVDARRVSAYGRIADRVADLHSDSRQFALSMIPDIPFKYGMFFLGYTYANTRSQARGFDAGTSGDPRTLEWAPGSFAPRHTVTAQFGKGFLSGAVAASLAFRASSGFTYTPSVAGDINGDGSSNDRAFIYNPSSAPDTALSNGLGTLLRSSGSARDCLTSQIGTIAGRGSCVGPWYGMLNGSFSFNRIPHNNRTRVYLSFTNITGAVDELLHGNDKLRGWGLVPVPDQTLYQVRGFDPIAKRFIYQVNPRFGASGPSTTTRRNPFRITLDVQLDLGRSREEQQVEQNIRIRPSMLGTRAPADTIKTRYLRSSFTDVFALILRNADSLALSRDQMERMQAEQVKLKARADSIYAELATYLVTLPNDFDVKDAVKHVTAAGDSAWNAIYAEKAFFLATLTPGQIFLLPAPIRDMVTTPDYKGRFFFGGL